VIFQSEGADETLNVKPIAGRGFTPGEQRRGASGGAAVISYALWQSHFGGDPTAIGATPTLDARTFIVIGVLPQGYAYPYSGQVWIPTVLDAADRAGNYAVFARMRPGVSITQVRSAVPLIAAQVRRSYPDTVPSYTLALLSMRDNLLDHQDAPVARSYLLKLIVAFGLTAAGGLALDRTQWKLPDGVRPVAWATLLGAFAIVGIVRSKTQAERDVETSSEHSIVLRIAEFALGNRIARIAQIASVETNVVAIEAIADADVNRRETWRERRVPFVQVPIADVFDDQVADDARIRRHDDAGREKMPRRHFKAIPGKLGVGIAKRLDEVDECAIVKAVADSARHVARRARLSRHLEALEAG
jgi:hypothetical protein